MYVLADIKRNSRKSRFIQEQRRLLKKFKIKKLCFLTRKILYFIRKSAKCIFWKIYNEIFKT